MRLFGSERVLSMMDSLGLDEDTPIDAKDSLRRDRKRAEDRREPQLSGPEKRS